jgi:hypothetical protein
LRDGRKPVTGDALEGAVDVAVGDERDAAAEKGERGDAGKGEKQFRADAEPARARAFGACSADCLAMLNSIMGRFRK